MVVYYYDVLEKNGDMIHKCLTGQEIIKILHLSENAKISQYARKGSMLLGRGLYPGGRIL